MNNIEKRIFYSLIAFVIFLTIFLFAVFNVGTGLFSFDKKYSFKKFTLDTTREVYTVFVCGAVQNSGYYTFEFGETYYDVLSRAGLLDLSYLQNMDNMISADVSEILCNFYEDGKEIYPINVNSDLFGTLYGNANIQTDIANKIIDYIRVNGKLKNKEQLLEVLTQEEWAKVFYRIYIGRDL